jgi:hypothetical protein
MSEVKSIPLWFAPAGPASKAMVTESDDDDNPQSRCRQFQICSGLVPRIGQNLSSPPFCSSISHAGLPNRKILALTIMEVQIGQPYSGQCRRSFLGGGEYSPREVQYEYVSSGFVAVSSINFFNSS